VEGTRGGSEEVDLNFFFINNVKFETEWFCKCGQLLCTVWISIEIARRTRLKFNHDNNINVHFGY
jgi:hypothetical protein